MGTASAAEQVDILEIVGFLQERDPETLARLRAEFPEAGPDMFKPGAVPLGATDTELRFNRARAKAALEALLLVLPMCHQHLGTIRARLLRASRIQLLVEMISVVSNSSLFVFLETNVALDGPLGYAAVTTSLVSTLLLLWIRRLNGSLMPGENSLLDKYSQLIGLRDRAEEAKTELQVWIKLAAPGRESAAEALSRVPMISACNHICREVRQIAAYLL